MYVFWNMGNSLMWSIHTDEGNIFAPTNRAKMAGHLSPSQREFVVASTFSAVETRKQRDNYVPNRESPLE